MPLLTDLSLKVGLQQVLKAYMGLEEVFGGPLADPDAAIKALFANNEQGVWYDPSDLSTMLQDAAGTTPVTAVGQPVGLILDKSKGLVLGPELATNGDFATDTGWTKGANTTISGGSANFAAASGYAIWQNSAGIFAGGYYEVTYIVSGYVSGTIRSYIGATATFGPTISANGTYTFRAGPITGGEVGFQSMDAFTGSIDNVSVKAISGNHATQATAAKRPLLQNDGVNNYLAFDGVDDSLGIGTPGIPIISDLAIFYGAARNTNSAGSVVNQMQDPSTYNDYEMGWNANSPPNIGQTWYQSSLVTGGGFDGPTTGSWGTVPHVFTATRNANSIQFRFDGANSGAPSSALTQPVSGGTKVFLIGKRLDGYGVLNGRIYSLIVLGRLATTQEITDTETWVAAKTGAYL